MIRRGIRSLVCFMVCWAWTCAVQAQTCLKPNEFAALNVVGLQGYLAVLALNCNARPQYEAHAQKFRGDWVSGRQQLKTYFDRRYGADGQARVDVYVTELANRHAVYLSDRGGSKGCSGLLKIFDDIARIGDWNGLAAYAEKKAGELPIRNPGFSETQCPAS